MSEDTICWYLPATFLPDVLVTTGNSLLEIPSIPLHLHTTAVFLHPCKVSPDHAYRPSGSKVLILQAIIAVSDPPASRPLHLKHSILLPNRIVFQTDLLSPDKSSKALSLCKISIRRSEGCNEKKKIEKKAAKLAKISDNL